MNTTQWIQYERRRLTAAQDALRKATEALRVATDTVTEVGEEVLETLSELDEAERKVRA